MPEQLVEGHTVFTVITNTYTNTTYEDRYAAAVAVLVRERNESYTFSRFPGVLWFNDQYLVNPSATAKCAKNYANTPNADNSNCYYYRYPCSGAVLAVNQGDPNPKLYAQSAFNASTYVESYDIVDPNGNQWMVDKWNVTASGTPSTVWSVAIRNAGTTADDEDDGICNRDPATDKTAQPCTGCPALKYNAVLFFWLNDLTQLGTPKNHTAGSVDSTQDVSGCNSPDRSIYNASNSPGYTNVVNEWPCPADDDNREGNSHPYNPETASNSYAGRGLHGGSADCTADATADQYCHATANVDIYYHYVPIPFPRNVTYRETEGSTAPYHCHEDLTFC